MVRLFGCLLVHEVIQLLHFMLLAPHPKAQPSAERVLVLVLLILTPLLYALAYRLRTQHGMLWLHKWLLPMANLLLLIPVLMFAQAEPWVKVDDFGAHAIGYQYAINPHIQSAFNGLLFFACLFVLGHQKRRNALANTLFVTVQASPAVIWILALIVIGELPTPHS